MHQVRRRRHENLAVEELVARPRRGGVAKTLELLQRIAALRPRRHEACP